MDETGQQGQPDEPNRPNPPETPGQSSLSDSFDFNRPTIVSLLYLSSFVFGLTAIVGVVLGYVWRNEPHADWESSHYRYLIRTFWIGFLGSLVGVILMVVLIGFFIIGAALLLVIVRSVLSLVNAQKQQPMPDPDTWLA